MAPISFLLDILSQDRKPHLGPHFDFLALPGEVRNQIYRLALTTDPPKLDREHKYNCRWCTWDPEEAQRGFEDKNGNRLPNCRCWAREGLALLLLNRKVHEEAATIFWAENHFSFRGVDDFVKFVSIVLRPRYRQMIPHVTIYSDPWGRDWMKPPSTAIWDVLLHCKGLQTLEIPAHGCLEYTTQRTRHFLSESVPWDRIARELPNLKTLSGVYAERCMERDPDGFPTWFSYPCRVAKCLDMKALSTEQIRYCCMCLHEDLGFGCNLCWDSFPRGPRYPPVGDKLVSTGRPNEYRYTPTDWTSLTTTMSHENTLETARRKAMHTTWTVRLYLLPLSPEAIARNFMLKARDQNLKMAGKQATKPGS